MKNMIIIVSFVLLTILPLKGSYAWMRDADIAHSKDSIRIGLAPDISYAYEKTIDANTSFGIFYWPYPLGGYLFKNIIDISYNKQFYYDDMNSWAFYAGLFSEQAYTSNVNLWGTSWITVAGPSFGLSYKHSFDKYWAGRVDLLYYLPTKIELAYKYSNNLEISLGFGIYGLLSVNYLF
jgi:hypothetical protein